MGSIRRLEDNQTTPLCARHVVGRDPRNADLCLLYSRVSANHAVLTWTPTSQLWTLRDLGSRNGTFLDGKRLSSGADVTLDEGAGLGFGHPQPDWLLHSSAPPQLFARLLRGDTTVQSAEGVLELGERGATVVYRGNGGEWLLEQANTIRPVSDGVVLDVGGQRWRLALPSFMAPTRSMASGGWSLDHLSLEFRVSLDEEDVELSLVGTPGRIDLPHRNHHYLLLLLARERIRDQDGLQLSSTAQGWMDRELVLRSLRIDATALDQYVHRARKELEKCMVSNGNRVVERRRGSGALRVGVRHLRVTRL